MEARALEAEKQLAGLNAAQLHKDAEAAVDEAIKNRKIAPASRAEYLALCSSREGFEKIKKVFAVNPAIISAEPQAPQGGPPPGQGVSLNSEDAAMAKAMGYTIDEYKKIMEAGK